MVSQKKFGARVYFMDSDNILVLQTVKRGTADNAPYVIDQKTNSGERFLDITNDKGIADAVRDALAGQL